MARAILKRGGLSAIATGCLTLGLLLWGRNSGQHPVPARPPEPAFSPYVTLIKDFSLVTQDNHRILFRIDAKEFTIRPKKFFVFNIKSIDEIVITKALLATYLQKEETSYADVVHFTDINMIIDILDDAKKNTLKTMFSTTGIKIKPFTLHVYKDEILSLIVHAEETLVTSRSQQEMRMRNCRLEDVLTGKSIMSREIIWDATQKAFKVPGNYLAVTPQGRATGKKIKVDIDFVVTALRAEAE